MIRETFAGLTMYSGSAIAIILTVVSLSAGLLAYETDSLMMFLIAEVLAFLGGMSFGCYYCAGLIMERIWSRVETEG